MEDHGITMYGKRITELRKQQNLTQDELANLMGISCLTLSLYESEKREPNIEILHKFSTFFNVSIDYILGNEISEDIINNSNTVKLGNKIATLRKQKGLHQKDFASILNVSSSTIGMWETDKRQPNLDMIVKIAKYFNVTADFLLDIYEDPSNIQVTNDEALTDLSINLGNRLKTLRRSYHKTQKDVCSDLHIEQSTIANYETGKRIPKLEILIQMAIYYNCTIDSLVGLNITSDKNDIANTSISTKESLLLKIFNDLL